MGLTWGVLLCAGEVLGVRVKDDEALIAHERRQVSAVVRGVEAQAEAAGRHHLVDITEAKTQKSNV